MEQDKIYIKNMVCPRCVMVVRDEFMKLGLSPINVKLGEVSLPHPLTKEQHTKLSTELNALGFELINDKRLQLVEQVKNAIIELVHYGDGELKVNLSEHLTSKLNHDYSYISNLFSAIEGNTVERYFITQKIERVKELLLYDELSLGEISHKLNYSSSAHLSSQFKRVTGLTPSQFKRTKDNQERKPLDEI